MLASITPLGERSRGSRWTVTATMYVLAATVGGAAIGLLAGFAGSLVLAAVPLRPRLAVIAGALLLGLGWEAVGASLPGPRRQVNEQWLDRYRAWVYGAGFGFQLGAGVTTVVVSSAVYGVIVAAFASASLVTGVAIGAAAGLLRGATLLMSGAVRTPQRLVELHQTMSRMEVPIRTAGLLAQLAIAGAVTIALAA